MEDNLFRFVVVRPPQRKEPLDETLDYIDPYRGSRYDSSFYTDLLQALKEGGRNAARVVADNYIIEEGFVRRLADLQIPLAKFDRAVAALGSALDMENV